MRRRRTPGRRRQAWRIIPGLRRHALDGSPVEEEDAGVGGLEPGIFRSKLVRYANSATASKLTEMANQKLMIVFLDVGHDTLRRVPLGSRVSLACAWLCACTGTGRQSLPIQLTLRRDVELA